MSSDEDSQTHYALLEGDGDTARGGRPPSRASSFAASASAVSASAASASASASLTPAASAPVVSTNPFDDGVPSTSSSSAATAALSSSSSSSSLSLSPSINPFDDDVAVIKTKNLLHAQSVRQPSADAIKSARYVSFGEAAYTASGGGGAFANGTHHSLDESGSGSVSYFPRAPASMEAVRAHSGIHSMDGSEPGGLLKLKSLIEFDVEPDNGDRPSDCLQLKTTCHFFCIYIPVVFAFVIGMLVVQYGSLYLVRSAGCHWIGRLIHASPLRTRFIC